MRFGLTVLSTVLHSFGSRKVQSTSSRNTHLPNIFARRDPRAAARSARLRAAKSAGRIRNGHSASARWRSTDPVQGDNTHRNDHAGQRARAPPPLRRCDDVLLPPPRAPSQPPGAYVLKPSFVVPEFLDTDNPHLAALVQDQLFLEALYAGRQVLLRAAQERREEAKVRQRAEDAEYACLLEEDLRKAREAQRRAEEAEYARLLEEDLKKAREAQRKAEEEEVARLLEEDRRKAQEAQRRAEARAAERREKERLEEERRKRAEQEEAMARARRERERRDREDLYRKAMAETGQPHLIERLRVYEETWAALRSNVAGIMEPLSFCNIPWPVFGRVWSGKDVSEERVREFVCHPLQEYVRNLNGGQAKPLRSEMLRWHPDKFEGQVLHRVVEADREAVKEAAGHVARILTQVSAGMR